MIILPRLCSDVFADKERSLEDLSAGLRDHFTRLTAYPHGGAFDGIITPTRALVERWNDTERTIITGQRTQQTGRAATDTDRETGLKRIRLNYAALSALEDDDARARLLKLFYPNGLEEFTAARIDSLDPLLDAYLDLLDDVDASQLPAGFATRTTADLSVFEGTRGTQISQQAITTRARQKRLAMVDEVTDQLTDNYHFLCRHFRPERGQVLSFYNRRYFERATPTDDDGETPAPAPAPGS